MTKIKTKKELDAKLLALGELDETTKKNIVCSLIGHSNIEEVCFGYVTCGRCGIQVGDTILRGYENPKQVIVGHNCEVCKVNYKKLTWKDKYLCPHPFKVESLAQ